MLRRFYEKTMYRLVMLIIPILEQYEKQKLVASQEGLRKQLAFCGSLVRINGKIYISHPAKVIIGNNVHIGDNAFFMTEGGLVIGDNTHISRNVTIYTVNHNYLGSCLPYDNTMILRNVYIGKNVWIGMNVSIIPGVTISDGAIVGIGSVVSKDVEPLTIVGGNPARALKYRDKAHYEMLESEQKYGGINGRPLTSEDISNFNH